MDLHIDPVARSVDKFQRMANVAMHETVAIGDAAITHEDHDLMNRLWIVAKVYAVNSQRESYKIRRQGTYNPKTW